MDLISARFTMALLFFQKLIFWKVLFKNNLKINQLNQRTLYSTEVKSSIVVSYVSYLHFRQQNIFKLFYYIL